VRAALDARALAQGWPALHAELARVDPATAQRLAPHDAQRIQRALEVWQTTGQPLSAWQRQGAGDGDARAAGLPVQLISLEPASRSWLHGRIAQRFDAMLSGGLLEEVQHLRARADLHPGLPSMRCVGYRQAWEVLERLKGLEASRVPEKLDPGTAVWQGLREAGIAATRQLAKRQLTWLRSMPSRQVLPCDEADGMERAVAATVAALERA
jgi:tRNA dimethylallyltransferase